LSHLTSGKRVADATDSATAVVAALFALAVGDAIGLAEAVFIADWEPVRTLAANSITAVGTALFADARWFAVRLALAIFRVACVVIGASAALAIATIRAALLALAIGFAVERTHSILAKGGHLGALTALPAAAVAAALLVFAIGNAVECTLTIFAERGDLGALAALSSAAIGATLPVLAIGLAGGVSLSDLHLRSGGIRFFPVRPQVSCDIQREHSVGNRGLAVRNLDARIGTLDGNSIAPPTVRIGLNGPSILCPDSIRGRAADSTGARGQQPRASKKCT